MTFRPPARAGGNHRNSHPPSPTDQSTGGQPGTLIIHTPVKTDLLNLRAGLVAAILTAFVPSTRASATDPSVSAHGSASTAAGPTADAWGFVPPSWLTDASVSLKEGYDSNLYGTGAIPLPGTPNIANVSSWFTVVSARLSANLLPARPAPAGFLTTLKLGYAADYTAYNAVAGENNLRNSFILQLKGKSGPWSASLDNTFLYVAGPKTDPLYATYSPLGYAATRERREQAQERNTSFVRYDGDTWFARAVASALYYDLLENEHNPVGAYKGYINWVNRSDANTGVDFGYKLTPELALTAGWRLGAQTQELPAFGTTHNDSTYNRALLGVEGKLLPWLQLQLVAGPDFRRYSDTAHLGLTGGRHTWLYTESSLTAALSPQDSLVLSNLVWHFASTAGSTSLQDTENSFLYKHVFAQDLSASAGVKIQGHRYDAPTVRNDWATIFPVNLTYAFGRGLTASLDYSWTRGRSVIPATLAPGRDWDERVVSIGLKLSF